jgi:ATP-binding cassette subfamily F protein uup
MTLSMLEEYLRSFRGCVIVVSHDRYFVDKVAEHLLVFCGDGEIKDFAGSYSEYLVWKRNFEAARRAAAAAEEQRNRPTEEPRRPKPASKRLSFREQQEFAALDAEIPTLESEKAELEALLSSGTLSHEELTRTAERIGTLIDQIDEKTMRWLELSERA